ncbi:MAG: hypothetical protein OXL96_28215 [Candidatus Poribacteria bacterium]|nr:hypothetical protein [Candidatus Poribacteria bacterium]
MQTDVYINFLRSADLPGVPTVRKIIVSANRVIDINCHATGGEILNERYDFSSAVSMRESKQSPNGYPDLIHRYHVTDDLLKVWIACVVPEGTDLPEPVEKWFEVTSFPQTLFLATGVTDGASAITGTVAWATALSTLSDAEKKAIAIREIEAMFDKKEADIENANKYLDLHKDLAVHVAYWWRAAISVVKRFFQDTTVDKLITAEIAKQTAAGPSTRDDQLILLRNLLSLITQFPEGPNFGAVWVETRNLSSPSDVRRKTMLQVLATRGTDADETYPMAADFDSTDRSWVV